VPGIMLYDEDFINKDILCNVDTNSFHLT